jgi:cation transport ATPase
MVIMERVLLESLIMILLILVLTGVILKQYSKEKTLLRIKELTKQLQEETDLAIKQEIGEEIGQLYKEL